MEMIPHMSIPYVGSVEQVQAYIFQKSNNFFLLRMYLCISIDRE